MKINEDYLNESKQRLFRACYTKGVSYHHLCLVETQRWAEEWVGFIAKKKDGFRYALIGMPLP